jgi:hypothetical protein
LTIAPRLEVSVVLFGEIFERFLDHLLVVRLKQLQIRLAPELLPLFVIEGESAIAAPTGLAAVGLPVSKFIFVIPRSMFRHAWHSLFL